MKRPNDSNPTEHTICGAGRRAFQAWLHRRTYHKHPCPQCGHELSRKYTRGLHPLCVAERFRQEMRRRAAETNEA